MAAAMAFRRRSKSAEKPPFSAVSGPIESQHTSRLMLLPAELRNTIYRFVLYDTVEYRARKTISYRKVHRVKATAPGLLLACKQTHQEAIQLFWAQSTFLFDEIKHLNGWIRKIGGNSDRAALTQSIRISSPSPDHNIMSKAYWEPRTALWLYSMEASGRLLQAQQGLPKTLRRHCKVQTDMFMPGSPEIQIVWTQSPVTIVEKFLGVADEKTLSMTHHAFLKLSNDRHKVW